MHEAVHREVEQLSRQRVSVTCRLPRRVLDGDHDVAERLACAECTVGLARLALRKREHVGRVILAGVAAVERVQLAIVGKRER